MNDDQFRYFFIGVLASSLSTMCSSDDQILDCTNQALAQKKLKQIDHTEFIELQKMSRKFIGIKVHIKDETTTTHDDYIG